MQLINFQVGCIRRRCRSCYIWSVRWCWDPGRKTQCLDEHGVIEGPDDLDTHICGQLGHDQIIHLCHTSKDRKYQAFSSNRRLGTTRHYVGQLHGNVCGRLAIL